MREWKQEEGLGAKDSDDAKEITITGHLVPKGHWKENLTWVRKVLEGITDRRITYVSSI